MKTFRRFGLWSVAARACRVLRWMLDLVGCMSRDDRLGAVGLGGGLARVASRTLDRVLCAGGCVGRKICGV